MDLRLFDTISSKLSSLNVVGGQLIVIKDTSKLYIDMDEFGRIAITDWIDLETEDDRTTLLAPVSGKFYYVIQTNTIYRFINREWVPINQMNMQEIIDAVREDLSKELSSITDCTMLLNQYNSETICNADFTEFTTTYEYNRHNYKIVMSEISETEWSIKINIDDIFTSSWSIIESEIDGNLKYTTTYTAQV